MSLKVYFDIPKQIALGLASGQLERIGGVIVEKSSKRIVAWLRESGPGGLNGVEITSGLLNAMQRSGSLLGAATGILDAALTARSHHLLMTELKHVTRLSAIGAATGMLNLGLGAFTYAMMVARANSLAERISQEAEKDRTTERAAVVEYLGILQNLSDERKSLASELAVLPLLKCKQNILASYEEILAAERLRAQEASRAIQLLVSTMQLDVLHVRGYLDTGEHEAARRRLKDCLSDYEARTHSFVKKLLGKYPAKFFHPDVAQEDWHRYLEIERWLRGEDDMLMALLEDSRKDFWNGRAADELEPGRIDTITDRAFIDYRNALDLAESLIENLQRLQGYELEIASLRMSSAEWDKLATPGENDFAMVVDLDELDNLQRVQ